MKTALAALALVLLTCSIAPAAPQDPLWQKAVETEARNRAWSPGTMTIRAQVFNDKGELTDTTETIMRTFAGPDGTVQTDVVKSVKNGKDRTEKDRQAMAEQGKKADSGRRSFSIGSEDNPFNPDVQDAVEARPRAETRTVGEVVCAMFDFTLKGKNSRTFTGTALIDPASGAPVEVSYTVTPLPGGVKSLQTVMRFGAGPEGVGYLREIEVSGSGSFLFISRSMKSQVTLENYWKKGGA